MIAHDALDEILAADFGERRCSSCARFGNSACALRVLEIQDPKHTVCVDHAQAGGPCEAPLGPTLAVDGEHVTVLDPPPADPPAVNRLLDVLESIEAPRHDRSLPQRMALWWARESGHPRTAVHVDRIEARARARRSMLSRFQDEADIHRLTLAGRLLALASLLAGGITTGLLARAGHLPRAPFAALVVIGFGYAFFMVGRAVCARLGIAVRTDASGPDA